MTVPSDTPKQALLRVKVERMMTEAQGRNENAEEIAEAVAQEVRARVQRLLREPLSEKATLVLHDDATVTWEEP